MEAGSRRINVRQQEFWWWRALALVKVVARQLFSSCRRLGWRGIKAAVLRIMGGVSEAARAL